MSSERWAPIVIGEPVAEFEPRPPRTRTYRPDTAADGWATERFVLRAASVRGYQHRHDGAPRQDDFAVSWHEESGAIVVAIADGVSSVELAHVGATLACRTAIDYLTRWLDKQDGDAPDWLDLVKCASWALVEFAGAQLGDGNPREVADEMLATTLVVALVRPREDGSATASLVQVGDSEAWVLHEERWQRLDGHDDDLVTPAVFALPRVPEHLDVHEVELTEGDVLVLGTDGLGGPLGDGSGSVGNRFAESLATVPTPLELAHLLDFSRETFDDDRTLVVVWPRLVPP
jgi:serine/threonine protein phosphatase PrpC